MTESQELPKEATIELAADGKGLKPEYFKALVAGANLFPQNNRVPGFFILAEVVRREENPGFVDLEQTELSQDQKRKLAIQGHHRHRMFNIGRGSETAAAIYSENEAEAEFQKLPEAEMTLNDARMDGLWSSMRPTISNQAFGITNLFDTENMIDKETRLKLNQVIKPGMSDAQMVETSLGIPEIKAQWERIKPVFIYTRGEIFTSPTVLDISIHYNKWVAYAFMKRNGQLENIAKTFSQAEIDELDVLNISDFTRQLTYYVNSDLRQHFPDLPKTSIRGFTSRIVRLEP